MIRFKWIGSLALLLLVGGLVPVGAEAQQQDSDQIDILATVTQTLSVIGQRDLNFGTVLGGATAEVLHTEPGSGQFDIAAVSGQEISLLLTQAPTEFVRVGGSETVPVALRAWASEQDIPSTATEYVIDGQPDFVTLGDGGKLYLWISGTATPAQGALVGTYEAAIELTVAYTGN